MEFNSKAFRCGRLTAKPTKLCTDTHIDHSTVNNVRGDQNHTHNTYNIPNNNADPVAHRPRNDDRLIILAMLAAGITMALMKCLYVGLDFLIR